MRGVTIILYLLITVIVGAVSDGLNDQGVKILGHVLGSAEIVLLISGAFLFRLGRKAWIAYLVAYISFRIFAFDYSYNITRGLDILYMGSSSFWDLFFSKQYPGGLLFGRVIFAALGVGVTFNELRK
jgi:hypothetical protein